MPCTAANHGAGSQPAPSLLLRSSFGPLLGLPGTRILQIYPEAEVPGSGEGLWGRAWHIWHIWHIPGRFLCLQQLQEAFLEEDFHTLFCALVQAASPPLFGVIAQCPGGDRGFLVPLVRFCPFSFPSQLFPQRCQQGQALPRLPQITSVPMGGLFWWKEMLFTLFFPILVMAVFLFPVYDKENESLALTELYFTLPVPAFPCRPACPVVSITECWNMNSWCLSSWTGALGRREGGESDFLLVNLFSPLCPGRSPLLCGSRACFPPRRFFLPGFFQTSGNGAAQESPAERI